MAKMRVISALIVSLVLLGCRTHGFVAPRSSSPVVGRAGISSSSTSALSVQLPRVDLPDAITDKLDEFGLKNPNTMTTEEYKNYSGSAILGTLLFFVVPGALVTGLPGELMAILGAIVSDFAISALVGGGAGIYLSLKDDELGATIRDFGYELLAKGKDLTGLETLRYDIPDGATEVMTDKLGLLNPNEMNAKDYDGYSGAAVAGTLAFFLLPGAALTGAVGTAKDFLTATAVDFVLSAIIGGGAFIYLSLRNDELSASVNRAGAKLLDTVDEILGSDGTENALPESYISKEKDINSATATTKTEFAEDTKM